MTNSIYKTPAEFDRAVKKAASTAEGDTGERYRQALRDRFLCRVFSDSENRFILKGGSGMLARVPNARATRDADFATRKNESPDEIVNALNELLAVDMGDYCRFALTRREESKDDNGYSRLLKLRYATYIGDEEKDPVLVDLSLDCEVTLPPEKLTPANRLDVPGLEVQDYLVYSIEDQLADKLCAIVETHPRGWRSSRMKDLTDVVAYALTQSPSSDGLSAAIANECARRSMGVPQEFEAPGEWSTGYWSFALKTKTPEEYQSFDRSCSLASELFDPILKGQIDNMKWNPDALAWE